MAETLEDKIEQQNPQKIIIPPLEYGLAFTIGTGTSFVTNFLLFNSAKLQGYFTNLDTTGSYTVIALGSIFGGAIATTAFLLSYVYKSRTPSQKRR